MSLVSDKIELKPEHFNSAGNNPYDGAASLSNIRDTCYGNQVKNQKGNLSGNFKKECKFLRLMITPGKAVVLRRGSGRVRLSEGVNAGGHV